MDSSKKVFNASGADTEAYLESCQADIMERFAKTFIIIFTSFIVDVWQTHKCASAMATWEF